MKPKAILLGSIGVVAETSDIQRRAYNTAFKEAGLDWVWEVPVYKDLLLQNGGRDRLARLGQKANIGLSDDAVVAIHARKTELACDEIEKLGVPLREGVDDLLVRAKKSPLFLAFVTTTYRRNIDAILRGSQPQIGLADFNLVLCTEDVTKTKPDPEVYELTLKRLGLSANECLAIEDSETSLAAAKSAGIPTLATPGAFTAEQDFSSADWVYPSVAAFIDSGEIQF